MGRTYILLFFVEIFAYVIIIAYFYKYYNDKTKNITTYGRGENPLQRR